MFKIGALALNATVDLPPMSFPGIDLNTNNINIIPPTEPIDHLEELLAYHSQIDKLNKMFNSDPVNPKWQPENIVSHHVQKETKKIKIQIQYPENPSKHLVTLEPFRLDEPWMCIRYDAHHDLMHKPGWK